MKIYEDPNWDGNEDKRLHVSILNELLKETEVMEADDAHRRCRRLMLEDLGDKCRSTP